MQNQYLPSSIRVLETGDKLVIERRWFTIRGIGLIAFAAIWNVFLVMYAIQLSRPEADTSESVLLIPLVIVGIVTAYFALANMFNRTRFTVDAQAIRVSHHPLPYLNKSVERDTLQQLVVKRYNAMQQQPTRQRTSYALMALLRNGKQKTLINSLYSPDSIMAIKKLVHDYLQIDAQPVEDEFQGW